MKFAIIAAGEGSRLAQEGVKQPKPRIELQGIPIIERLVMLFAAQGASCISIIVNSQQPATLAKLQELQKSYPIDIVVKDTPSSMHSLHALARPLSHIALIKHCGAEATDERWMWSPDLIALTASSGVTNLIAILLKVF